MTRPTASKRLAAILAVVTALTLLGAQEARADATPPRITAFALLSDSPLGPGDRLRYSFSASDNHKLSWVTFGLEHETYGVMFGTTSGISVNGKRSASGESEITLGRWIPSGTYRLSMIGVWDLNGNSTIYYRDGSIEVFPETATSPPPLEKPLRRGDFDVSNPNQDITAPILHGAQRVFATVDAGQPAVVEYRVSDERSGIRSVGFRYAPPPDGHGFALTSPAGALAAVGPASYAVPFAAVGGLYRLDAVSVEDRAGNTFNYSRDGTVDVSPEGIEAPPPPLLNFSDFDITVNAKDPDTTAPTIASIGRTSPKTLHPGEYVILDYRATDEWVGIAEMEAEYADPRGVSYSIWRRCGNRTRGPLSGVLTPWKSRGKYVLQQIRVTDHMGNSRFYRRNGAVQAYPVADDSTTHPFDFAAMDFFLEDGESRYQYLEEIPENSSNAYCPPTSDVTIDPSDDAVPLDDVISLDGTVRRRSGPRVRRPVVALYSFTTTGRPKLVDVRRGNRYGRFSGSTIVRRKTTYRARFLGYAGPSAADPRLSEGAAVRIVKPTELSAWSRSNTVRFGGATTIAGRLRRTDRDRPLEGFPVRLLRRPVGADSFRRVDVDVTSATGRVSFRVRPRRTTEYRLRFAGTNRLDGARSRIRRIAVRPIVTAVADGDRIHVGDPIKISGSVTPAREGRDVWLQRLVDGAWRTVKVGHESSRGTYRFIVWPRLAGFYEYRVVTPARRRFARAASAALSVAVR